MDPSAVVVVVVGFFVFFLIPRMPPSRFLFDLADEPEAATDDDEGPVVAFGVSVEEPWPGEPKEGSGGGEASTAL